MRTVFAVDYNDGKVIKKAGATVPKSLDHKRKWLLKTGLAKEIQPKKVEE